MEDIEFKGDFGQSLDRNNKEIKRERSIPIYRATQMAYKRKIEDLEFEIEKIQMKKRGMIDLSPTDKNTITKFENFDSVGFVNEREQLNLKIRNLRIILEESKNDYKQLFGEDL